jgi:hypothetical protein
MEEEQERKKEAEREKREALKAKSKKVANFTKEKKQEKKVFDFQPRGNSFIPMFAKKVDSTPKNTPSKGMSEDDSVLLELNNAFKTVDLSYTPTPFDSRHQSISPIQLNPITTSVFDDDENMTTDILGTSEENCKAFDTLEPIQEEIQFTFRNTNEGYQALRNRPKPDFDM